MADRHLDVIWSVGELSALFTESSTLDAFLQRIVAIIAEHMSADVCSIYLLDDDGETLRLVATRGLEPAAVGSVSLKRGEGIVGQSIKELRPIQTGDAAEHPSYRFFPGIGEEVYHSFIAIPMLRGKTQIGVVTIQHRDRDFFNHEDLKALQIITSQLASAVENARLVLSLHPKDKSAPARASGIPGLIKGRVASEGFAYGRALVTDRTTIHDFLSDMEAEGEYSLQDFRAALERTTLQLEEFQRTLEEKLADIASLIFSAHLLMLRDRQFVERMEELIKAGQNPVRAVAVVVHEYTHRFTSMNDAYMREKAVDIEDLGKRLIDNLMPGDEDSHEYRGKVVISRSIFPSDMIKYFSEQIGGVVSIGGGVTSHVAILARSLDIPMIITDHGELLELDSSSYVLLDAGVGNIYIDPEEQVLKGFQERQETRISQETPLPEEGTFTKDGEQVRLLANINLLRDVDIALKLNAAGVGLYRTEFPFLVRNDFPSEEEQYMVYRSLVDKMGTRPLVFRTLDVGGDKIPSYYNFVDEQNPFLGMRSIRFSLREKGIFKQQLRAILRAGEGADLSIMFPMVAGLDEFLAARDLVRECLAELKSEAVPHNQSPGLGIMIELPAVLGMLDELAQEVDFFSIGTNDLVQYLLAVDRTSELVSYLYKPHHPAVLRALSRVAQCGHKHGIAVSVCGDMGRDAQFIDFFIGIGIRAFSVESHFLPFMHQTIQDIDCRSACEHADRLLQASRIEEVEAILEQERGESG